MNFLVCVHPFQARLIPQRIVEGEPDSLLEHDSNLPPLLERILARGLAKNPADRYKTGHDFGLDLEALRDSLRLAGATTSTSVQLPSDSVAEKTPEPRPRQAGDKTLLRPIPEGDDPNEWYLSEVMRLLPQFESKIEEGKRSAAQELLAQLEAIESIDMRFEEALGFV